MSHNIKILVLNVPHPAIGSRIPMEHLPPLGLLSIAGPLIDAGFKLFFLDADFLNLSHQQIIEKIGEMNPEIVMMGHSGSTSAQPIIEEIALLIKRHNFGIRIILGGVFPTYYYEYILKNAPQIDIIVKGEGESVVCNLIRTLSSNGNLDEVKGIAFQKGGKLMVTEAEPIIENLDDYRIAWELTEQYDYRYWGNHKAVVVQFSRGCPYPCTYCGQRIFWKKFRNRNPQKMADEMEMLHKKFKIEVFNFADENPSSNKTAWKEFLEAIIAKKLNIKLVASIRADNIVRDENILSLYKQAGFERFLLGIENYNQKTLQKIGKTASKSTDRKAIELLRKHHILSMATYVVGFQDEKLSDFRYTIRQLLQYDPDQIQIMYVTPHHWTPFFGSVSNTEIIQKNLRKWDYKHQVLRMNHLKPWQTILLVKITELILQTRLKAIVRTYFQSDKELRKAMQWYTTIGRKVWFFEWFQFIFKDKILKRKKSIKLSDFFKNCCF